MAMHSARLTIILYDDLLLGDLAQRHVLYHIRLDSTDEGWKIMSHDLQQRRHTTLFSSAGLSKGCAGVVSHNSYHILGCSLGRVGGNWGAAYEAGNRCSRIN